MVGIYIVIAVSSLTVGGLSTNRFASGVSATDGVCVLIDFCFPVVVVLICPIESVNPSINCELDRFGATFFTYEPTLLSNIFCTPSMPLLCTSDRTFSIPLSIFSFAGSLKFSFALSC